MTMSSHTALSARVTRTVLAAFVAIAVSIPAALAQVPGKDTQTPAVTVNYSDLNLATEEGSRALYGRLVIAARQVCPEPADTLLAISQNSKAQRCITQTVERAVKEIKNPRFAELAATRTP